MFRPGGHWLPKEGQRQEGCALGLGLPGKVVTVAWERLLAHEKLSGPAGSLAYGEESPPLSFRNGPWRPSSRKCAMGRLK